MPQVIHRYDFKTKSAVFFYFIPNSTLEQSQAHTHAKLKKSQHMTNALHTSFKTKLEETGTTLFIAGSCLMSNFS